MKRLLLELVDYGKDSEVDFSLIPHNLLNYIELMNEGNHLTDWQPQPADDREESIDKYWRNHLLQSQK